MGGWKNMLWVENKYPWCCTTLGSPKIQEIMLSRKNCGQQRDVAVKKLYNTAERVTLALCTGQHNCAT